MFFYCSVSAYQRLADNSTGCPRKLCTLRIAIVLKPSMIPVDYDTKTKKKRKFSNADKPSCSRYPTYKREGTEDEDYDDEEYYLS